MPRLSESLRAYDKDNGHAGMYCASPHVSKTAAALTSNRASFVRFVPSRTMRFNKIAFAVTTASGTDDPCDVGIYDSTLANRLVSSGPTTGKMNGSAGRREVDVTAYTVNAGVVYYAAFVATSTASVHHVAISNTQGGSLFGAAAPNVEVLYRDLGSGTLGTSVSSPSVIGNGVLLALIEG